MDRKGKNPHVPNADMGFTYRHCGAPDDLIFTEALLQGSPGEPANFAAEMDEIKEQRETTQPTKTHRRLDLQEPTRQEVLAAHRRRRLPRSRSRPRAGLRTRTAIFCINHGGDRPPRSNCSARQSASG